MALKGNLQDFSVTQLLNLINLANKSGSLVLEAPQETAWLFFREGKLAYTQIGLEENSLVTILFKGNKLNANQYTVIKDRSAHMSDKELGLLLINANYLSQKDILSSLQNYHITNVQKLLSWSEGSFHFDNDLKPPDGKITVRADLENIIMEGARRVREREQLMEEIPSLEMALKFAERPEINVRSLKLTPEEWKVISYINPKNTMRQIARATKLNDTDIRRIVYSLLQAGLAIIVRPEGIPQPVPVPGPIPKPHLAGNKEEQRSLIDRIINRIRSL